MLFTVAIFSFAVAVADLPALEEREVEALPLLVVADPPSKEETLPPFPLSIAIVRAAALH